MIDDGTALDAYEWMLLSDASLFYLRHPTFFVVRIVDFGFHS